jgi:hypothetical protein
LFDHRDISDIYFLSGSWTMRRNDYGDMDSNGCMRKSACTGNKNDYGQSGTGTCIYGSTWGCNGSVWIYTCSTDSRLQQWSEWNLPDIRDSNSNKEWNDNRLRRHTDGQLDVYGCVWKDDQRIKSDYGYTSGTAGDDSTGCDHHCMWSDTSIIDINIH